MAAIKKRSYDILLGSFVALGILALIAVVFLIGRERRLFDATTTVEAHFSNVAGLNLGADVMLAGVRVGHVRAIQFPVLNPNLPGLLRDVTVVMEISKREMPWIKEDSIARIDSKGLLGDKLINISIGSPALPQVQSGGMLKSTPPVDFNKALQQAQEILENVTETIADAKDIFKGFVAEGGDKALASSAESIRKILKEVESGKGVLHELIYDEKAGENAKVSIKSIKNSLEKFEKTSDDISRITHDIKNGNGMLHALIYDGEGAKSVAHLNQSLASLSELLAEVKQGSGIAHDLIYTDDQGQFVRSLNAAAHDIKMLTTDLKNGKGSLGLLLKDPGLYNQLYGLIGNLGRNRLLKAIIRYGVAHPDK